MKKEKILIWGLVLLSAVLLSIPYLIPHTGFLALIALVPLLCMDRIASELRLKHVWVYHYSTFVLWNAMTTFWVCNATVGGGLFAIFANALQMSLIFSVFRFSKKKFSGVLPYLLLMTMWIGWERAYFDAEISWPWLVLGNAFAGSIRSVQWYEFTGTLGGSLWIWTCNLAIFGLMVALSDGSWQRFNRKARIAAPAATILLFTLPFIVSSVLWHTRAEEEDPARTADVLIVQPNIDPYHKFEFLSQKEQTKIAVDQIEAELEQRDTAAPLLVLTPETFTNDVFIRQGQIQSTTADEFQTLARNYPGTQYLVGASAYEIFDQKYKPSHTARKWGQAWLESHNSALCIGADRREIFHKNKLVVGVEYMPFPAFFSKVDDLLGGVMGRCKGQGKITDFHLRDEAAGRNIPFGCAICYESVYGEYFTGYIREGAQFMTIITNDAWWGNTPGYRQHLRYASLRAIETRRDIARCANTGLSALISSRGEITAESHWWEKETLKGKVRLNDEKTFFVTHGDIAGRLCYFVAVLLLLSLLVQSLKTRK